MPLYEYKCDTCHHQFEVQQKFSDPLIEQCGRCGAKVRKLISAPGIMFKGTGWYVTDYSNKLKEPNQAKQSEGQAKDKPDSGPDKGATKPEAGSAPDSGSTASSPESKPAANASSNSAT